MRNHGQDDFDWDRKPNRIEHSKDGADPRDKWLAAGANDDLAFLMAMLALAEGGGQEEPTARHPPLPQKETSHGRAEDPPSARPASSRQA